MVSAHTEAILFGHNTRHAGAFLGLAAVSALLTGTGTVIIPMAYTGVIPSLLLAGTLALSLLYAFRTNGLVACWIFIFAMTIGPLWFSYHNPTSDAIHSDPGRQAVLIGYFFASLGAPVTFSVGAGLRVLARRIGAPDWLAPPSCVTLSAVFLGDKYRGLVPIAALSLCLSVVFGIGAVVVDSPFGGHPPSLLTNPLLLGCSFLLAVGISWWAGGLLPSVGATFLVNVGVFGGYLLAPEGAIPALTGALWYGLLIALMVGVPGAVVGLLAPPGSNRMAREGTEPT